MGLKNLVPKKLKQYIKTKISADTANVVYHIYKEDIGKLQNKKIVVTGATGAIGSSLCRKLYLEGAIVGVAGRNKKKIDALIARLQAENTAGYGRLVPLLLEVTDENSIDEAIDTFVAQEGSIDAFINNAGGGARKDSKYIHEQSIDIIDLVINTNLRGTILCARKVAQKMVTSGGGIIVNMSSVVGMRGKEKMSDYAAAKAGIIGFTQSLALELGRYNIRVNCVSPGMVNQMPNDAGLPVKTTVKNCLKRFGYTDEVVNVITFLLSDDAKYITGQNIVVDGGRSLGLMGD